MRAKLRTWRKRNADVFKVTNLIFYYLLAIYLILTIADAFIFRKAHLNPAKLLPFVITSGIVTVLFPADIRPVRARFRAGLVALKSGWAKARDYRSYLPDLPDILGLMFNYLLSAYLLLLIASAFWSRGALAFSKLVFLLPVVVALGIVAIFRLGKRPAPPNAETAQRFKWIWFWGTLVAGIAIIGAGAAQLSQLRVLVAITGAVSLRELLAQREATPDAASGPNGSIVVISVVVGVSALAVGLSFSMGWDAFRLVFGAFYLLFFGGWMWSYALFERQSISAVERIALSFLISAVALPLLILYLSRAGMPVTVTSVLLVNLALSAAGWIAYRFRRARQRDDKQG